MGILAGDRIVSVNDTAIAGVKMSKEEIMHRLRGPKGTKVKLGIVRRASVTKLTFTVVRDKIPVKTLDAAPDQTAGGLSASGASVQRRMTNSWKASTN